MSFPAALSASAPSASWLTVAAPPFCSSVNDYYWIIPSPRLPLPTFPICQHASVVRNVALLCCEWNLFLPGTLPNFYSKGLVLTLPNLSSIPLTLTESFTPIAFVSLSAVTALDQPPTPVSKTRLDTLSSWPNPKLPSLTTLLLHSHRRMIFESPNQIP
jgi:hypothetical protein